MIEEPGKKINFLSLFSILGMATNGYTIIFFIIMAGFAIGQVFFDQYISTFSSKITTYIGYSQKDKFQQALILYAIMIVTISICITIKMWFCDRLAILFRKNIVGKIHLDYMQDNTFNDLLLKDANIDNIDARITQDVQDWSTLVCNIVIKIIQMPVTIIMYTILVTKLMDFYTVLACVGFSVVSMILSYFFMKPVAKLTYQFHAADGDFRFAHVNLKENAEVVVLSSGQEQENNIISQRLKRVIDIQTSLANRSAPLTWISNLLSYFGGAMEYVCLWIYLSVHGTTMSGVDLSAFAYLAGGYTIWLISGLTTILSVMVDLSKLAGYNQRISELCSLLAEHRAAVDAGSTGHEIEIVFKNATIARPTGELLVTALSLDLKRGDSLFITGPSGAGKSSIFRAIAHVWPLLAGELSTPHPTASNIIILTQSPYLPAGTLDECVTFPRAPYEVASDVIDEALSFLGLSHLRARDPELWSVGLSPGEKQRVALARILIHRPSFALLDEATSAIPQVMEAKVFNRIISSGVTLVSIAHNLGLRNLHKYSLDLNGIGGYKLYENK